MEVLEARTAAAGTLRDAYDAFADRYDAFTWDHDYEDWVSTLEGVARAHGLTGDRVLHIDLHPENVIISPAGPVVIDWSGASAGPGGTSRLR